MSQVSNPKVSIVVTSYDPARFKDIVDLLESIQGQTCKEIETIVVTERSIELHRQVEAYIRGKNHTPVRVLFNQGRGLSSSRNLGIQTASGEIIAFVDDDAILFPDWAEQALRTYQDRTVIGVTGPILPLWENESFKWVPRMLYWLFSCTYYDWTERREVRNGYGTNMSFRREAFVSAGLFNTDRWITDGAGKEGKIGPSGDDTELAIRVRNRTGKRIIYDPSVKVKHKVFNDRLSPKSVRRRCYWQGYSDALLKRLFRSEVAGKNLLATEHELLRRIFLELFPGIFRSFFTKPVTAWRQLWLTLTVLFSVALGYLSYATRGYLPPLEKMLNRMHGA